MRLDKLVLHGFKSFADKTTFEFTKDFTAIVGPNGSGKSNISDAIRWVLGEQSMKTLRGKSSNDVIFHGSDKLSKLGMAQVELHMDNSDGQMDVDYKEVIISRKIFQSGESEYRINNAKVRLQDIIMLLAKAKFGQKSYAVIGQGMITHFLNASPQERKEFFDEATGVKEYQIKRDQAINKLIRTEENLVQAETLLAEIEPHLQSLTRQVKRLEKREKVETELREQQQVYYGSLWSSMKDEHKKLTAALQEKEQAVEGFEKEMEKHQQASDVISQESSRGERYQQLQKAFNDVLENKSALLKEQAVLKGKLEVEHERQGELSLVWLKRKEDELMLSIHQHQEEVLLLQEKVTREQNELARAEKAGKAIAEDFRAAEYNILKLKEQVEQQTHSMTVPEIRVALQDILAKQEEVLQELLATQSLDAFRAVQTKAKGVTKQLTSLYDRLSENDQSTVEALRVEMKHKEQMLEKLVAEREKAQNFVNELRVSIHAAEAKMSMIQAQLDRAQKELSEVKGSIVDAESSNDDTKKQEQREKINTALQDMQGRIDGVDAELEAARKNIDIFNQEEEDKKTQLVAVQNEIRATQRKLTGVRQEMSTLEVNMARIETRREDIRSEVERDVPEEFWKKIFAYTAQDTVDHGALEKRIVSLHRQLEAIGSVDEETVKEHAETQERFDFLQTQTTDLSDSIQSLEKVIDELDTTIKNQFQKNFKKINQGFQDYFKVLFGGGKAKLVMLTDEDQEQEEKTPEEQAGESLHQEKERELIGKKRKRQKIVSGIDILAQPAGKKITNVTALSGGEKSMTSIALLCSIIANNPSPFVFLDEVEAALDEENSEKLAAILKELAQKTQIIIITHNRVTMRASDMLYGVTIGTEGKSHILSVELEEAEDMVEDEPQVQEEEMAPQPA